MYRKPLDLEHLERYLYSRGVRGTTLRVVAGLEEITVGRARTSYTIDQAGNVTGEGEEAERIREAIRQFREQ